MSLAFASANWPNKPAAVLAETGACLSYAELEGKSAQLAQLFHQCGLEKGDRIAILMENNLHWFVVMWAARRAGMFFVPVNWHLSPAEASYVVKDSGARILVTTDKLLGLAQEIAADVTDLVAKFKFGAANEAFSSIEEATADLRRETPTDDRDGGSMPYSSGTSGKPKGILRPLSGEPFGSATGLEKLLAGAFELDERTIYLSPAPLYHSAPVGWTMAVQFYGGTVVAMQSFEAKAVLEVIRAFAVTHAQFVPTHFVRLLKLPAEMRERCDLSSLKMAIHAAAPCAASVKHRMIEWWGPILREYYSGSERCGFTTLDSAEWLAHQGSVGRSRTGAIRIVDAQSRAEIPRGAIGLVFFENAVPFVYHNDPGKTQECLLPSGWGTFGDLGYLDDDGYLYLVDRLSDMIISGGVNIYPQEIENVIAAHPGVLDVAVIGVPNEEYGEEVKAIIIPNDPAAAGDALAADIIRFCKTRIAGYKCPRSVDFTTELPHHPNGKLLKRQLKSLYWPATPAGGPAQSI